MNSSDIFVVLFLIVTALVADGRKYRQLQKQVPKQQKEEFIINGQALDIASVPYQCAYRIRDFNSIISVPHRQYLSFSCGCSIIHPWFVLTAAHCIVGPYEKEFNITGPVVPMKRIEIVIRTGTSDKSNALEENTYVYKHFIVHESYSMDEISRADIALVMVNRPIRSAYNVKSIELIDNNYFANGGMSVYLSGYGRTTPPPEQDFNVQLYRINMTTVSHKECGETDPTVKSFQDLICAKGGYLQSDCRMDSGGPLVSYYEGYVPKLVGVVSFGDTACLGERPSKYANVYLFRDWIYRTMNFMENYYMGLILQ